MRDSENDGGGGGVVLVGGGECCVGRMTTQSERLGTTGSRRLGVEPWAI